MNGHRSMCPFFTKYISQGNKCPTPDYRTGISKCHENWKRQSRRSRCPCDQMSNAGYKIADEEHVLAPPGAPGFDMVEVARGDFDQRADPIDKVPTETASKTVTQRDPADASQ